MSSPEAFLAKISHLLDEEQESQERGLGSGKKWLESSMRYDLATHGWKTHRCLWDEALSLSSVTLPRWGMMQDGVLWERITQAPLTSETGYGFWLTPKAHEHRGELYTAETTIRHWQEGRQICLSQQVQHQRMWPTPRANESRESLETIQARKERTGIGHMNLTAAVKSWPTPQARDWKGPSGRSLKGEEFDLPMAMRKHLQTFPTPQASEARQGFQDRTSGKKGSQKSLSTIVQGAPAKEAGGALNPSWVEWLMGWPVDWTDITKPCAGNFAQWQAEQAEWWDAEPDDVPRVINGERSRVNRLHAIGNGQVPAALVLAWTILTEE